VTPSGTPSGTPARARVRVSNPESAKVPRLKIAVGVIVLTVVLVISLYGWHQIEQFLIHDSRFATRLTASDRGRVCR